MSPPSTGGDARLVRRAATRLALQTGLAAAIVVAVVLAVVLSLSLSAERDGVAAKLEKAIDNAEGTLDEHGTVGTAMSSGGELRTNPGWGQVAAGLRIDDLPRGLSEQTVDGVDYLVRAEDAAGARVVAFFDLTDQQALTTRLLQASIIAALIGVAAAGAVGWFTARRAVQPLADALTRQRRFVADASHELRTPLTILHTRAQLLRGRVADDPRLTQEVDRLIDDSRVLTDVVDDLLLSAESQHHPEARQPVDLARVARDVASSFEGAADDAGVDLVVDHDASSEFVVAGAASALRRATAALVDNAIAHSARGGGVSLSLTNGGRAVSLLVADDGDGIDPALVGELTERFRRGDGVGGSGRRFGLGLALVNEVVQAHDGAMTIDGRPGEGTTVTLTFPTATRTAHA